MSKAIIEPSAEAMAAARDTLGLGNIKIAGIIIDAQTRFPELRKVAESAWVLLQYLDHYENAAGPAGEKLRGALSELAKQGVDFEPVRLPCGCQLEMRLVCTHGNSPLA